MKKRETYPGKAYAVTTQSGCSVYADDAGAQLIKTIEAGQGYFVAIGSQTWFDDDAAIITETFNSAALAVLGGGGNGGNGGGAGIPAGDYLTFDENNVVTGGRLQYVSSLRYLQAENSKIKVWNIPMPQLKNADHMFYKSGIEEFSAALDSLQIADYMFRECQKLRAFSTTSLESVTSAHSLFYGCPKITITVWEYDMPALTNAEWSFPAVPVTTWRGNLSKLSNGYNTFNSANKLSIFEADLLSLSRGDGFMNNTILNKTSALRVFNTIPAYTSGTHNLTIGIHVDHKTDEEVLAAIEAAEAKGWTLTVQWNGTAGTSAASTYGLRGPIVYARVAEDEYGRHLEWGHYVSDPTGYEEFRSVEAAREYFGIEEN